MRYRVVAAVAAGVVLLGGGIAAKIARGQSAGTFCCDPTTTGVCAIGSCAKGSTSQTVKFPAAGYVLSVQTTEPASGFTGACLVAQLTYTPQLPTVCYVPGGFVAPDVPAGSSVVYGSGSSNITLPAAAVARAYALLPPSYDSYQVMVTCYPHTMSGGCPQASFAVSNSCCDMGTNMTSLDGQSATAPVAITD
jgi:hypothetical protein